MPCDRQIKLINAFPANPVQLIRQAETFWGVLKDKIDLEQKEQT